MRAEPVSPNVTAGELRRSLAGPLKFVLDRNKGDTPGAARRRVSEYVSQLERHLGELGIDKSLIRPLRDIRNALNELDRGNAVPLVEPIQLTGRPRIELRRMESMVSAALAIDLLKATGMTVEQASRQVATSLSRLGFPIKNKIYDNKDKPEWEVVRGWREELSKANKNPKKFGADWKWMGWVYASLKTQFLPAPKKGKPIALRRPPQQLRGLHLQNPRHLLDDPKARVVLALLDLAEIAPADLRLIG